MRVSNVRQYVNHLIAYFSNAFTSYIKQLLGIRRVTIEKYGNNPLHIPKYGAEGVVHPDLSYFPDGLDGFKFWLFYTPFPPESLENPCLVRSNNGIDFTDLGVSNPLISVGKSGDWDDGHLADVEVVKANRTWYLYYVGADASRTCQKIGLATSKDGKTFTKYPLNPVLEADTSLSFETGNYLVSPTVVYSEDKFLMWYFSEGDDNRWRMCFTESPDGKNWTKYKGNPVLKPTLKLYRWDNERIWHGDVIHYLGEYWLCYSGFDGHIFRLGLARSKDGSNWEKYVGNPILDIVRGTWEGAYIYRPSSVIVDGKLWLYYSAFKTHWRHPNIGLAWYELLV